MDRHSHPILADWTLYLHGITAFSIMNYPFVKHNVQFHDRVIDGERERAKRTTTTILWSFCEDIVKINPEGTCGPIWPEVVPLVLSHSWHQNGTKNFVNWVVLNNSFIHSFIHSLRVKTPYEAYWTLSS